MRSPAGDPIVQASVTPHARSGHSIHDVDSIDATNVGDFEPDPERKRHAARRLRALGFSVVDHGGPTLTVRGSKAQFERAFSGTLRERTRVLTTASGTARSARFFHPHESTSPGLLAIKRSRHPELATVARGLALAEPVQLFGEPSVTPPRVRYRHLTLPAQVAAALNTGAAHRAGITGTGISVAICDSGCYPHPWFARHGNRVRVVLTPGASSPDADEVGHGTVVAANLLSIAPGCTLTMIKMNFADDDDGFGHDAVPALQTAYGLGAQIVNCSWGQSLSGPQGLKSAHMRTMEYSVAWLTARGRVIVCAAGNFPRSAPASYGELGFPAQHPDAIAIGGAMLTRKGGLKAASYASGFQSPVYRSRVVPDVCGLCGDLPAGVLIMAPVQPGCIIDRAAAQRRYPLGDETGPEDGWSCVSGTSSAAPQVAGAAALVLQANPHLQHTTLMRAILGVTARDVTRGSSNPRATRSGVGHRAHVGPDLATGTGLVDASAAVAVAHLILRLTSGRRAPVKVRRR